MRSPNMLPYAAVAAAEALVSVASTTMFSHRELTHRSLELDPELESVARAIMKMTGVTPEVWAAVHLVHHRLRDANMAPIIELADFIEHQAKHSRITGLHIPETFSSLDPVALLTPDDVLAIGGLARQEVAGRYKPPDSYSDRETRRLLNPTTPRYFYPDQPGWLKQRFGKDTGPSKILAQPTSDLYRLAPELRDPHSPALHPQGTRGVLLHNVRLYRQAAAYFTDPANRPAHLRGNKRGEGERPSHLWMTGLFAGNIVLAGLKSGLKREELPGYALAGSAVTAAAFIGLILGGNITNSFGHGGEHPMLSLITGKLKPKPDGTFATKSPLYGPPTLDEVGGQDVHHERPDLIAYSLQKGWRKLLEAPFGTGLEFLAKRAIGMKPGPGFDVPFEQRPDVASEAVLMLEGIRKETLALAT